MLRASLSRRSSQTEKAVSATAFLKATVAYDSGLRVTAARVMTNIRTKPYPLKTNGKAERFIQTALREWAKLTNGSSRRSQLEWSAEGYARAYQRAQDLPYWTHQYNLQLQTILKSQGYYTYPSVAAYQRANDLEPVGYVGPKTRQPLNRVTISTSNDISTNSNTVSYYPTPTPYYSGSGGGGGGTQPTEGE
jgi:hypothetical protein